MQTPRMLGHVMIQTFLIEIPRLQCPVSWTSAFTRLTSSDVPSWCLSINTWPSIDPLVQIRMSFDSFDTSHASPLSFQILFKMQIKSLRGQRTVSWGIADVSFPGKDSF